MRNFFVVLVAAAAAFLAAPAQAATIAGPAIHEVWVAPPVDWSNLFTPPDLTAEMLPSPSVEKPPKRLYCVEYARAISGIAIVGDAKYWWARARNLYARLAAPVANAVMVFRASSRIRLGHLAVVTAVISSREVRIDQANWQNHGEIEHDIPVRDVSAKNDWSAVRVWDIGSKSFGRVYPLSGFIAKGAAMQAAND